MRTDNRGSSDRYFEVDAFYRQRLSAETISCKSFIVTVFGDVVSQHGDWIWLGSLIHSLAPLGFSERLIRTSVFRLVKEDWLQVKKVGRKSYYAFTQSATRHYSRAAKRIYAGQSQHSDGRWLIVIPCFVAEEPLNVLKKQLRWLGFSALTSGAFAHPSIEQQSLIETLNDLDLSEQVIVFSSRTFDQQSERVLKQLVHHKWNVEQLQQSYKNLQQNYQPLLEHLGGENYLSDAQCFLIRLLLIHEYRRILLNDHELPQNLLPQQWSGATANRLVKDLYRALAKSSNRYIMSELSNMDGTMLKAAASFKQRFQ